MDSSSATTTMNILISLSPYAFTAIALLIFIEQITYMKKKSILPGPSFVLPFIGNAIALIRNPTRFWEDQSSFAKSSELGVSSNYIIGRFIVFIRDSELSHNIFSNVRPDAFHLVGHPFGKKLFGEHNLIYMFGQEHKDLRGRIAPNFTAKALSAYTALQREIISRHLKMWIGDEGSSRKAVKLRLIARDMNLETSQTVFVGPYLNSDERKKFNADYNLFNVGLMTLPIDLPGFAFRNATLAVKRLGESLAVCAERSRQRMEAGGEPVCLIDFWMQETLRELTEAKMSGEKLPAVPSNAEIGGHVFDFLFAAQDASTSSLLWAVTLLESHPGVLAKVREEVAGIWSPASGRPISSDKLREMKYTEAVAREVVRFRAPATLVPHIAGEEFRLTESYTIPKGTIVFPSVFESSFQGFTEPDRFDPDRFYLEERQEDRTYKKNFLIFGAGPHQCVGQRYAINHLVLFMAMFTSLIDFRREKTDGCDDIIYVPTICPKDDCTVYLSMREGCNPTFA